MIKKIDEQFEKVIPGYREWNNAMYGTVVNLCLLVIFSTLFAQSILSAISGDSDPFAAAVIKSRDVPDQVGMIVGTGSDQIVVKYKKATGLERRETIRAQRRLTKKSQNTALGIDIYKVDITDTADEVVQNMLKNNSQDIEYVEVDTLAEPALVPNDASYPSQWSKSIVGLPTAWDTTTGSASVIVGIADSGVDCGHPDLSANCVAGWNFYDNNADASDTMGHGTAVAGVVGAIGNNGLNTAGSVWNVKIMPLRIGDPSGLAYGSTIAQAITYAADRGVKVVNNSYALASKSLAMQNAARYLFDKGGMLVTSAGNSSADTGITTNNPYFLTVSGTDGGDSKYSWSSYGIDVDLAAPGCSVTTARGGGDRSFCGTSNAAPEVSGLLALMYSFKPNLTATQARDTLFATALDRGTSGWDSYYGWGRIQGDKAIQSLNTGTVPTPPAPPADTTAPTVPQGVNATAVSSSGIKVSWSASTDAVGVTGYNIYRNGSKLTTVTATNYSDSGLQPNTAYTYSVSSFDAAGNTSAQSVGAGATTQVAGLTITSFNVSSKTSTTASITWTTNAPSSGSVSYGANASRLSGIATTQDAGTVHTATITGLSRNTKYYYRINALSGSSSVSSSVSSFKTNPR